MECIIGINVTPKSSKSAIVADESAVKVYLYSLPLDGRTNEECVELFEKIFKMPKSMIAIEKSRKKTMLVHSLSREKTLRRLGNQK